MIKRLENQESALMGVSILSLLMLTAILILVGIMFHRTNTLGDRVAATEGGITALESSNETSTLEARVEVLESEIVVAEANILALQTYANITNDAISTAGLAVIADTGIYPLVWNIGNYHYSDPGYWDVGTPNRITFPYDGRYEIGYVCNSPANEELHTIVTMLVPGDADCATYGIPLGLEQYAYENPISTSAVTSTAAYAQIAVSIAQDPYLQLCARKPDSPGGVLCSIAVTYLSELSGDEDFVFPNTPEPTPSPTPSPTVV
jgi:hypothetical protein